MTPVPMAKERHPDPAATRAAGDTLGGGVGGGG